ncbi:MAG: hypothetical protein AAGC60_23240 [Acidobacteriota bacterium]
MNLTTNDLRAISQKASQRLADETVAMAGAQGKTLSVRTGLRAGFIVQAEAAN